MRYIELEHNLRKTLGISYDNIECFVIERHFMIIYVYLFWEAQAMIALNLKAATTRQQST